MVSCPMPRCTAHALVCLGIQVVFACMHTRSCIAHAASPTGIIVCEGLERDVRSFIAEVRALSWQAMQVRAEEVLPPPGVGAAGASAGAPSRADGQQEAAAQPAGGRLGGQQQAQGQGRHWCFADPFFELPETGMSEMSQLCREGGIEHLFLAALKLDKS